MQPRPIRSQLYLPILRFGITDEDWGFVILASLAGYGVPFILRIEVFHVPVELIGWLVMMGASILTFNLLRRKSRPGWIKYTLRSGLRGRVSRSWLPAEHQPDWLVINDQ